MHVERLRPEAQAEFKLDLPKELLLALGGFQLPMLFALHGTVPHR